MSSLTDAENHRAEGDFSGHPSSLLSAYRGKLSPWKGKEGAMTQSTSAERPEMGLRSGDPSLKSPSSTPLDSLRVCCFFVTNLGPHHLYGLWQWPLMAFLTFSCATIPSLLGCHCLL